MARYRRMTDPGYKSPFLSRMPGIPVSMEDDRDPVYEYKNRLGPEDNIWDWEKRTTHGAWVGYGKGWYSKEAFLDPDAHADFPNDHHKEWRDDSKSEPEDDGMWGVVLWMAGIPTGLLILFKCMGYL